MNETISLIVLVVAIVGSNTAIWLRVAMLSDKLGDLNGTVGRLAGDLNGTVGKLAGQVDGLEKRFTAMEARFDRLERTMDQRFDRLEELIAKVRA